MRCVYGRRCPANYLVRYITTCTVHQADRLWAQYVQSKGNNFLIHVFLIFLFFKGLRVKSFEG